MPYSQGKKKIQFRQLLTAQEKLKKIVTKLQGEKIFTNGYLFFGYLPREKNWWSSSHFATIFEGSAGQVASPQQQVPV